MAARDYFIAYDNSETGGIGLLVPAWDDPGRAIVKEITLDPGLPSEQTLDLLNDDEFLDYIQLKDVPEGATSYRVLASDVAQLDRYFRSAWEWSD